MRTYTRVWLGGNISLAYSFVQNCMYKIDQIYRICGRYNIETGEREVA